MWLFFPKRRNTSLPSFVSWFCKTFIVYTSREPFFDNRLILSRNGPEYSCHWMFFLTVKLKKMDWGFLFSIRMRGCVYMWGCVHVIFCFSYFLPLPSYRFPGTSGEWDSDETYLIVFNIQTLKRRCLCVILGWIFFFILGALQFYLAPFLWKSSFHMLPCNLRFSFL